MDNLTDIKKLWLTAKTGSLPEAGEVVRMAKRFRNQKLLKKMMVIAAGLVLTGIEVLVVFTYKSNMLSTRIGEAFIIIAGTILIATNTNSIGRFYRFRDFNNKEFIAFLEQTRVNQIYFYNKTQLIALAFCSAGLLLYLFEGVHQNLVLSIAAYGFIVAWIFVLGFIVRPKMFKKQTKKLDEIIKELEKLSKQLD